MPDEDLIDGGFVTHENIEVVTARGAAIYAPPAKSRKPKIDPCEPREDEPPAVAAWRLRMKTEEARRIGVLRGAIAKRTNADLRGHRRLDRLNVTGLAKVTSVMLLAALTYNVLRLISTGMTA